MPGYMTRPWTHSETEYLKQNYPEMSTRGLARIMGRSYMAVDSRAKLLRLRKSGKLAKRIWTKDEDEYLKNHYYDTETVIICKHLDRPAHSVFYRVKLLKLSKSPALKHYFTGVEGIEHRYEKGHIPANKGKKMSADCFSKCSPTMFKPGHLPHNTKYDGCITVRSDKYFYIRLSEGKWKELHRYIWEKQNGEVPKGYNIVFKDGNPVNCKIENLEMVSNAELMLRNTVHNLPQPLKEVIQLVGVLNRKINEYEKQH